MDIHQNNPFYGFVDSSIVVALNDEVGNRCER